jgi:hypothetical protein
MKLILFSFVIMIATCNPPTKPANTVQEKLNYDTSKITIIPFENNAYLLFDTSNYSPSTLTQEDILDIEYLFNECVNEYNSKLSGEEAKQFLYIDLDKRKYKRQYICATNNRGEKTVYVNCFCDYYGNNWKTQIVRVFDWGSCAFQLRINLTHKEYSEFNVNGG